MFNQKQNKLWLSKDRDCIMSWTRRQRLASDSAPTSTLTSLLCLAILLLVHIGHLGVLIQRKFLVLRLLNVALFF